MKILYNASPLIPPLTGIGVYTKKLSDHIAQHQDVKDVRFFLRGKTGYADDFSELRAGTDGDLGNGQGSAVQVRRSWRKKILHAAMLRYSAREYLHFIDHYAPFAHSLVEQASYGMEYLDRKQSVADYIYHETNFVLQPHRGPKVVSIHDLGILHYPEFHPAARVSYIGKGLKRSAAQADHIITISDYVKNEIVEHLGVDEAKVTSTYPGVDPEFQPRSEQQCQDVLARYKLNYKKYLLVVGSVEPRKNLSLLIDAYQNLPNDIQQQYPLLHIGPSGWNNNEVQEKTDKLSQQGLFRSLGYVDANDIATIYSAAHALAFPSFYEGFGIPPLEAMSSGIPVLVSNSSALPEVVGDCGIVVDPYSLSSMTDGLGELLSGSKKTHQMAAAGMDRAKIFSWQTMAEQTLAIYRKVQN